MEGSVDDDSAVLAALRALIQPDKLEELTMKKVMRALREKFGEGVRSRKPWVKERVSEIVQGLDESSTEAADNESPGDSKSMEAAAEDPVLKSGGLNMKGRDGSGVAMPLPKKQKTATGVGSTHDADSQWRQTRYQHWYQERRHTEPRLGLALLQLSLCSLLHPRLGTTAPSGLVGDVVELLGATVAHVVGFLGALTGHSSSVTTAKFSPDGTKLVSASEDNTVRVWDIATGECEHTLQGHTSGVFSAIFSTDGTKVVSASADKTARVWDVATGECEQTLGLTAQVLSARFSPDGTKIVSASGSFNGGPNIVCVWNTVTGERQQTLEGHTQLAHLAQFSPDGTKVLSKQSVGDKTVRVWDVATGKCEQSLRATAAGFSTKLNGTKLVSASDDNTAVNVWDVATGKCERTFSLPISSTGLKMGFLPTPQYGEDGTTLISIGDDDTLRVWDVATGVCEQSLNVGDHSIAGFSPSGTKLATMSDDHTVHVWDIATGECRETLDGHTSFVNSVWFSPDSTKLVTASVDKTVRVCRVVP